MKKLYLLIIFIHVVLLGGCGESNSESEAGIINDMSLQQENAYDEANYDIVKFE